MEYEFIVVTLISTIGGLIGLYYMTSRKDRRSDIAFDRKLNFMEKQSKIKMTEVKTRNKIKQITPIKTGEKLNIDGDTIKSLITQFTSKDEETEEDEGLIEKVIDKIPPKTLELLANKYLGNKGNDDDNYES